MPILIYLNRPMLADGIGKPIYWSGPIIHILPVKDATVGEQLVQPIPCSLIMKKTSQLVETVVSFEGGDLGWELADLCYRFAVWRQTKECLQGRKCGSVRDTTERLLALWEM